MDDVSVETLATYKGVVTCMVNSNTCEGLPVKETGYGVLAYLPAYYNNNVWTYSITLYLHTPNASNITIDKAYIRISWGSAGSSWKQISIS